MKKNFISINLKRLRQIRGLTQENLAQLAGVSRVAYRNIETGKSEPRVGNLQKIADALEVNIQEIFTVPPQINSLRFRSHKILKRQEKSKREQIAIDLAFWLKDYNELEETLQEKIEYVFSEFKCGNRSPDDIAGYAREKLGLQPDDAIKGLNQLLEHHGIKMYLKDSDLTNFFGLCVSEDDGGPAIGLNISKGITVERQIFTTAHELGHLLLHQDSFNREAEIEIDLQEREADQFASSFLMPNEAFQKSWQENKGLHWFDNILLVKRIFRVSYKTVIHRLIQMQIVNSTNIWMEFHAVYKQRYGKSLTGHQEPEGLDQNTILGAANMDDEPIGLIREDFIKNRLSYLVRKAYEQRIISLHRAAEILKIDIEEMKERIRF